MLKQDGSVWATGEGVKGKGQEIRVQGSGFSVQGLGFRGKVADVDCRATGSGFRVWRLGFRVPVGVSVRVQGDSGGQGKGWSCTR